VGRGEILAFFCSAALAFSVTYADSRHAWSAKAAADRLTVAYSAQTRNFRFSGHWGFQYYMEAQGSKALDLSGTDFHAGDIFVVPKNNTGRRYLGPDLAIQKDNIRFVAHPWIATMSLQAGAGFYADAWGVLPFVFGPAPDEEYVVFELLRSFSLR
jgi:hypothetical protein